MTAHVCKVCKQSSDEISDFILCRGNCKQYLHYSCANTTEDRFRSLSNKNKRKWKCVDCRGQGGLNSPKTNNLDSENDSGNSLSSNIGSVDSLDNLKYGLPIPANELNALRQELTQTVKSLEQLRAEYNELSLKVADFEQQMRAQATNLNKVSVCVRDTNKNVHDLSQNAIKNRLEIHGLHVGVILTANIREFDDEIKRKIVDVGKCFKVKFSVQDIAKVDILKTQKNPHKPILLVQFFFKEHRDRLIAARRTFVMNAHLPGCSVQTRIYINENLTSYCRSLWYEARSRGFKFVWVREGNLFVKKHEESRKKRITCKEDLDNLEAV